MFRYCSTFVKLTKFRCMLMYGVDKLGCHIVEPVWELFPTGVFAHLIYQQLAGMQYLIHMVLVFTAITFFQNTAQSLAVPGLLEMSNLLYKIQYGQISPVFL